VSVEIKITIVICISKPGQTIDAGNEVDTASPRLKSTGLMIALVVASASVLAGSFLPVTVVAEFELDSVIPPPDTVEEESEGQRLSHLPFTLRSTQNVK
jgi:hypothetical protein